MITTKKILQIFLLPCLLLTLSLKAQDNVGIGTNTPNASAILELLSSNKGLLIPRMNTAGMNAISSPSNSLLLYNTDSMCYFFYRQPTTSWVSMCNLSHGNSADSMYINYSFIDSLFASYSLIDSLFAHYINVDSLFANYVNIDSVFANYINADSLFANYTNIDSIFASYINTDSLFANYGTIDSLIASHINVDSLFANYGNIDSLFVNYLNVDSIFANYGNFDSLTINGTSIQSLIDSLISSSDSISLCSNATANYVTKFTSPTSICNSIIYDNGTNVGVNTTSPTVSFQINSTDAIGVPSGTTAQRPALAPVGSTRYNTTTGVLEVFNGTCWQNVNTPPIGSTYIQWFNAADPNTIYPCTVWISTDISNGEFIRATGGLSNVAAPPLSGIVQGFATQDHTHSSLGTVGNSATLSTSTNGSHSHGGNTTNVSSFSASTWIPYDDNLSNDAGNSGDFSGSNPATCGTGWDSRPTGGNFMGQLNQSCLDHTHGIITDGSHLHTISPHNHSVSITVGNMDSGNTATETRPTNVAVTFWRRTQ